MSIDVARALEEESWDTLVSSVLVGKCTPFLGAGVSMPHLPSGAALSKKLAEKYKYPLWDPQNLPRVAQYLATTREPAFARRQVAAAIEAASRDYLAKTNGQAPDNHTALAKLGLPLYITTNYDDFMERALRAHSREPVVENCRWNDEMWQDLDDYPEHKPTPRQPIVFHLHGDLGDEASILVTEDDYIDFTVSLALRANEHAVLWHQVRRALAQTNLLFIGYSLADWNFRVLMRYLISQQKVIRSKQYSSLSIQLSDDGMSGDQRDRAEGFLAKYLRASDIQVHWSDASAFLQELGTRVEALR
jgi:hypothetical protein